MDGLLYLTKDREIKYIPFREQRQQRRELQTVIDEDFFPIYANIDGRNLNFTVMVSNGGFVHDLSTYTEYSMFIGYVLNNKNFDLNLISDEQFIPLSTEIFISYSDIPVVGGGGGFDAATEHLNNLNQNVSSLLAISNQHLSNIQFNTDIAHNDLYTIYSNLVDIKAILENSQGYHYNTVLQLDSATQKLQNLVADNVIITDKLTDIELNTNP